MLRGVFKADEEHIISNIGGSVLHFELEVDASTTPGVSTDDDFTGLLELPFINCDILEQPSTNWVIWDQPSTNAQTIGSIGVVDDASGIGVGDFAEPSASKANEEVDATIGVEKKGNIYILDRRSMPI